MNFLDNLEQLMLKNNIKNISVLSKESNIPYTTLKIFIQEELKMLDYLHWRKLLTFLM